MRKEKFEAFYEELCDTLIDDEFAHLQDGSLNLDEVKMYRFYKIKAMFESSQQNFTGPQVAKILETMSKREEMPE